MSSFVFHWQDDGNLHSDKVIEDDKVLVLVHGWYYIATKISEYIIVPYENNDINPTK